MKGIFVVIEGIDGSGKTTIIRILERSLRKKGYKVKITREPTKGPIGKVIQRYIEEERERDLLIEALLFAADRRWHNLRVIIPSLEKFDFIVSDRYIFSSLAYQTVNNDIDEKFIISINRNIVMPDYSFFIDISPEESLKRIKRKLNLFEKLDYLKKVYEKYRDMVKRNMLISVDGRNNPQYIVENILDKIL